MTTNTLTKDNITAEPTTSTPKWKYIPLTQGKRIKVSIEDFPYLNQFKWYWKQTTNTGIGYAARMVTIEGQYYYNKRVNRMQPKQRVQLMHRVIMGVDGNDNRMIQVDHINHDTLDNRRENLRLTTPVGNINNLRKTKRTSSGVRGVSQTNSGKWAVHVQVNRENVYGGAYDTIQKATRVRNKIRKQLLEKHKEALKTYDISQG